MKVSLAVQAVSKSVADVIEYSNKELKASNRHVNILYNGTQQHIHEFNQRVHQ